MTLLARNITRITLLCYLLVASMAAAHTFPSGNSLTGFDDVSTSMYGSVNAKYSDCHQVESELESGMSPLCDIFCSVTANAISIDFSLDPINLSPSLQIAFNNKSLVTRELTVEPQPPK